MLNQIFLGYIVHQKDRKKLIGRSYSRAFSTVEDPVLTMAKANTAKNSYLIFGRLVLWYSGPI